MNSQPINTIENTVHSKTSQRRHQHFWIGVLLSVGLTLGMSNQAAAHCKTWHPHHCVVEVVVGGANWVESTGEDAVNWVDGAATEAFEFVEGLPSPGDVHSFLQGTYGSITTAMISGMQAMNGYFSDLTEAAMIALAEVFFEQMADPMLDTADAWKTLYETDKPKFETLKTAIQNQENVLPALEDVLLSLYSYTGFTDYVDTFKDEGAGSILLIVSAGGGTGVTVEGDIGIALDIDYLIHMGQGNTSSSFDGSIGSIFTAVGVQIGPAAGGGVDFVVGYHTSSPTGVSGLGVDISLEFKAKAGMNVGIGINAAVVPWQVVSGVMGVGAGAEVKVAVGPSYAAILVHLCSNGILRALARNC